MIPKASKHFSWALRELDWQDLTDMRRMGKPQQFIRHFRLMSIISLTAISTAAWEMCVFFCTPSLINGGRAGLVYSMISSTIGFGPVYLSMAEMSSIAPTAGAQYHWVSEFAPENCQRVLSYITGYVSVCHPHAIKLNPLKLDFDPLLADWKCSRRLSYWWNCWNHHDHNQQSRIRSTSVAKHPLGDTIDCHRLCRYGIRR